MAAPNQTNQKKPIPPGRGGKVPSGPNIWVQMAIALFIFILLSGGYSLVRQYIAQSQEIVPLSQIADDINAGKISSITVEGDTVNVTYTDKTTKTSRK